MKIQQFTAAGALALVLALSSNPAFAQRANQPEEDPQTTRQAQAVSRALYEVIEKAQVFVEAEDFAAAVSLLTARIEKGGLTEYELANLYQYLGFSLHNMGDTKAAIAAFSNILAIESLEEQMRKSTLYTISQLYTVEERYDEALQSTEAWFELEPNPAPGALILYAQILYQLGRYGDMIAPIEEALSVAETRGRQAKEQWYTLLSFAYFQQENFVKIRDINKILIANWPKKQYWLYLANAYRELDKEDELLAAYDSAHLQGMLESEAELVTLAQLYLQAELPFKAAKLLETEMESGRIEKTTKNYRLLSQAWSLAREDEKAVGPLKIAAERHDNGDLYIRLANVYTNLEQNQNCVDAAEAGINKGGLKSPDYAQMSLGMCLYNLHEYVAAIRVFRRAEKTARSASTAKQWIRIANIDIRRDQEIEKAEAQATRRFQDLAARRAASDRS